MERPVIKDKEVLAYVKYLEDKISGFAADNTVAKSYHAKKRYIDENNRLLTDHNFTTKDLNDKDEKIHDRLTKYVNEIVYHNKDLKVLEAMVSPEALEAVAPAQAGKYEEARSRAGK